MKADKENLAKELAGARISITKEILSGKPQLGTSFNLWALPAGCNNNKHLSVKPLMVIFNLGYEVGQEETRSSVKKRVHIKGC